MIDLFYFLFFTTCASLARPFMNSILPASPAYSLGILMLLGYTAGHFVKRCGLPSISGYLLAGILIGPFGIGIISFAGVEKLKLLNGLALSLIALTAGGEIRISGLKINFRFINYIVLWQTILLVSGLSVFFLAGNHLFGFFPSLSLLEEISAGLLIGIISVASSPSTTLAVIVESKIQNACTEIVLGIVMLKDILVLILFSLGLNFTEAVLGFGHSNQVNFSAMDLLVEVFVSMGLGLITGKAIVLYLKHIRTNSILFILGICFLTYELFTPLGMHPLLIMMTAGFFAENFSTKGEKMMNSLKAISPPVYVIFFTLAGAALHVNYLKHVWLLALIFVFLRFLLKMVSAWLVRAKSRDQQFIRKFGWMAFLSQAGLSLGMAALIENRFPLWGKKLAVLIVSIIFINQLAGPVTLKIMLARLKKSKSE